MYGGVHENSAIQWYGHTAFQVYSAVQLYRDIVQTSDTVIQEHSEVQWNNADQWYSDKGTQWSAMK